jgi:hypothetical protein
MTTQLHDIESESLAAHVALCAERYQDLDSRITRIEKKLTSIDITLCEIRDSLNTDRKDQFRQILTWAGVIITTLLASVGWLLTHYVVR